MSAALDSHVPEAIRAYFAAMNELNSEGMAAVFTDDGLVNDIQREFWGADSIKRWAEKESIGDNVVTTDFRAAKQHHGSWIITSAVDGTYDKTHVPDPLVLTYYFTLDGDCISSLIIVGNKPGY